MIKLIINADDFGYSEVFNKKILELLRKGFIKSTTVLVNRVTKEQDNQIKRLKELHKTKRISVGLHLDFVTGKDIAAQIKEQYNKFIFIFDFSPDHLDIHKLINSKGIIQKVNKFSEKKDLPVRNHGVKTSAKHTTYPAFYPPDWVMTFNKAVKFLSKVEDGNSCELITHPGEYDSASKSSLNKQRRVDYETIIKLQDFIKSTKKYKNVCYLDL